MASKDSLVRGLLVLECFTPNRLSFSLSELSKYLDLPKSSLHRTLKTLFAMNYLRYEEATKQYFLGTRVLSLGFSVLGSMELREIARPYMEKLSRDTNKTVNLAVFDKDEMVYVERIRVPGIRTFNISIGARIPLLNTAVGRAVLAYLNSNERKVIFAKLKKVKKFNANEMEVNAILSKVKKDGFAINDQVFRKDIIAVAVPIFSINKVEGAINIILEPEDALNGILQAEYIPKLIAVGKDLSMALGYNNK